MLNIVTRKHKADNIPLYKVVLSLIENLKHFDNEFLFNYFTIMTLITTLVCEEDIKHTQQFIEHWFYIHAYGFLYHLV